MVSNREAIRSLFRVERSGNLPALSAIFPAQPAPVVCNAEAGHELKMLRCMLRNGAERESGS